MSGIDNERYNRTLGKFSKWGIATIVVLYLLILAGGIVRSSGAGMGCPDWPMCFDRIVPPTSESQLPDNYQEIYKDHGYGSTKFNVVKTWTEYLNRLLGVLTGFFILVTFGLSIRLRKQAPRIFYLMLATFVLVLFQGWLGGQVVATNLHGLLVSAHMILALVIVALVINAVHLSTGGDDKVKADVSKGMKSLIWVSLILLLIQIVVGTQVREELDQLAKSMTSSSRQEWVNSLTHSLEYHRLLALPIIGILVFAFMRLKSVNKSAGRWLGITVGLGILQILLGVTLSYLGLPPSAQALHILVASMFFGAHFYVILWLNIEK